jgi:hypothetical protein
MCVRRVGATGDPRLGRDECRDVRLENSGARSPAAGRLRAGVCITALPRTPAHPAPALGILGAKFKQLRIVVICPLPITGKLGPPESMYACSVALLRALEQLQPPGLRILNDPYAAAFLQDLRLRLIARSWLLSSLLRLFLKRWSPGAQEMITLRARLVDDLVIEMPTEPEQIVIHISGPMHGI